MKKFSSRHIWDVEAVGSSFTDSKEVSGKSWENNGGQVRLQGIAIFA